jgi:uncharacterized protein YjbJ (UPF0337 family)
MEQTQRSADRGPMAQDFFATKWQQMRGTLRSWWGKLTDDDWERIAGHKDRLISMLQEKYGYAKDMAMREVDRRFQEYSGHSGSSEGASTRTRDASQEMRNAAHDVSHSAAQTYSDAKAKAQELGAAAAEKVGGATKAVGEKISSWAGTLRDTAPREGTVGSAAKSVASQLESAGSYLQDHTVDNMARDLTDLIRRYPMQAMLIGLGIGYLFSRRSTR